MVTPMNDNIKKKAKVEVYDLMKMCQRMTEKK